VRKKRPSSPVADSSIIGYVDGIDRGRLHGWVFDRTNPSRRLTVAVRDQRGHEMLVLADRYRADVHQSGFGDGYYGFSLPMRNAAGAVSVRVGDQFAVGLPGVSPRPHAERAQPQVFQVDTYTLHVDGIGGGQIRGWAVDISRPELRRALQLHCNRHRHGQQRATLYRAEIVSDHCDGYHGFWFSLPSASITSLGLEDVGLGTVFLIRL